MVQPVKSDVNDLSPESVGLPGVSAVALALQPTPPHAQQGPGPRTQTGAPTRPSWNPNGVPRAWKWPGQLMRREGSMGRFLALLEEAACGARLGAPQTLPAVRQEKLNA
jgi:hypothetical protein